MKKVLFAVAALIASVSFASAQTTSPSPSPSPAQSSPSAAMQDEKVKIKSEELPDAVKKSLTSADYQTWQVSAAYKYSQSGAYEVELKNGAETKTVKFDKDGLPVDTKSDDKKAE